MTVFKNMLLAGLVGLIVFAWPDAGFAKSKFASLVNGSLSNRYRLRTTGGVSDHDLESLLSFDVGNSGYDKVTASVQGGGIFDLNGDQTGNLDSVYDTFDSQAVGRLYSAYVSVQKIEPIELLRVGRQHNYDFESFYFDGVSFESQPIYGFRFMAYGGVPVHLFENQFGLDSGDWLAGSALTWTPIRRLRLRFDYAHLRDDAAGFRVSQAVQSDDLLGASLWLDLTKTWDAYARFTSFADQVRDVSFGSTLRVPKHKLQIQVQAYRLLEGYDIRVPDLDAYSIVGTYQPYSEIGLTVTKALSKRIMADAGFTWRQLDDTQTTGAFNHGYKRGYLALTSNDLLVKGLRLSGTADYYHGEDSVFRNNYFGGSFFATQKLMKKRLSVSAGTAYYLYHFNFATGNESDDVQTYFSKIEAQLTKQLTAKVGYEFEHNDFNGFHTAQTSLIWNF